MTRVFMHVGMEKTGSTSIQAALDGFDDGNVRYADLKPRSFDDVNPSGHNHAINTLASRKPMSNKRNAANGWNRKEIRDMRVDYEERIRRELSTPDRLLVFSGESICRLEHDEVAWLDGFMREYTDDIRALAYYREPIGLISSRFQQVVKSGRGEFLTDGDDKIPTGYRSRFESFVNIYGSDRFELRDFDEARRSEHGLIGDFCQQVGIDPSQLTVPRTNESLSTEAVALIYLFNQKGVTSTGSVKHTRARGLMAKLLGRSFSGRFRLDSDFIRSRLRPRDCAWMEKNIGKSFDFDSRRHEGVKSEDELLDHVPRGAERLAPLLDKLKVKADTDPVGSMNALYGAIYGNYGAALSVMRAV
ncbi:MAG: hypothetical protein OIF47_13850 [Marinibacterium sp.]|nr:hypothetical protein [Marinibacterium sp.]